MHHGYEQGLGFSWLSIYPNKNSNYIAIEGTYPGNKYFVKIFDISNPISPKELENISYENYSFKAWNGPSTFEVLNNFTSSKIEVEIDGKIKEN